MSTPKYSIIIPVYNGMPYLQACVESILEQDYENYEVIISNDHSTDGSTEYLRGLQYPNLTIVEPDELLSMTEHWEWALSFASGEWQIFVGQDDGLQSYFFRLADQLTAEAKRCGLRSIASRRAYYFWPGCEELYAERVGFSAVNSIRVKRTLPGAIQALFTTSYFDLPQMYCSSIFHISLLAEARNLQEGRVFSCHPQDANLAAISCSLEKHYLRSEIPLGWIGTSPKSAGLAIASEGNTKTEAVTRSTESLRKEYVDRVQNSRFRYNELAGDFRFTDICVYFWQALIETPALRSAKLQKALLSSWFRCFLFSAAFARIVFRAVPNERRKLFSEILFRNQLPRSAVAVIGTSMWLVSRLWRIMHLLFIRIPRKAFRTVHRTDVRLIVPANSPNNVALDAAGVMVERLVKEKGWV